MKADIFTQEECNGIATYTELAKTENNPQFKKILNKLAEQERGHYNFWLKYSAKKDFSVGRFHIFLLVLMRKILGLVFIAKFLEKQEKGAVREYEDFLKNANPAVKRKLREIIRQEEYHETALIGQIKERRVEFFGNVMLGLNDALIELTGALIGFSLSLFNNKLVALTGTITGIAAALSMTASAYMQASHDKRINPADARKSSAITGISYFVVVALLVLPFILISKIQTALIVMFAVSIAIVIFISFYTSVLLERNFTSELKLALSFSLGIALITFIIGLILRKVFGISV